MSHIEGMKESDLPGLIKKRLEELGRSVNWLAKESGVSRAHIYAFIGRGNKLVRLRWENLEKVFATLGFDISIEVSPKSGKALRRKAPTPPEMPL